MGIDILNDHIAGERQLGIGAGLTWGKHANKTVVYTDLGISGGMEWGIMNAIDNGRVVEFRTINLGGCRLP